MPQNAGSCIIAGATGATGRELVICCVNHPDINRIVALSRKEIPSEEWPSKFPGIDMHKAQMKLQCIAVDWETLAKQNAACDQAEVDWATKREGDMDLSTCSNPVPVEQLPYWRGHHMAFQCLGTTKSDAGGDAGFIRVDKDYTKAFIMGVMKSNASAGQVVSNAISQVTHGIGGLLGKISEGLGDKVAEASDGVTDALTNNSSVGLLHFAQLSSSGADATSWNTYLKTKGETDRFLANHFSLKVCRSKAIFRPGLLDRKDKMRAGEKFFACCCCCCGTTSVETLAEAVLMNALRTCLSRPEEPQQQGPVPHSPESSSTGGNVRPMGPVQIFDANQIKKLASPSA